MFKLRDASALTGKQLTYGRSRIGISDTVAGGDAAIFRFRHTPTCAAVAAPTAPRSCRRAGATRRESRASLRQVMKERLEA